MRWNLLYPLWVWLIGSVLISIVCACWPAIYNNEIGSGWSFPFRAGFFCGVLVFVFQFSVILFLFLALLYYVLAVRFYLRESYVKFALIFFFLIGSFVANRVFFEATWVRPFCMIYAGINILLFLLLFIYQYDVNFNRQEANWDRDK